MLVTFFSPKFYNKQNGNNETQYNSFIQQKHIPYIYFQQF